MIPSILVIADSAQMRDGRLDITGIQDRRVVPAFPAVVKVVLVMHFRLNEGDWGDDHVITVRLVPEDGPEDTELATLTGTPIKIPKPAGDRRPASFGPVILPLEITFPAGGIWNFEVHDNGVFWQRAPYVVLATGDPRLSPPAS